MRDSGKIITTARQDELDKLSEGINFAFSRQFTTLRQHWQHALFSPLVMQLTAFGIGEPQPSLTGVASYSPQGVTTCVLTDSPLHTSHHCVLCSQCTDLLMRPHILHQKRPHPPSRHTTAQHTPFTPFTPFTRMHPPHTLASCMNPTAELMQVESSGGSTKDGESITTGDAPAYPTPLPIFVPVSFFQDDNSNPLDVLAVNCHTAILGKSGGGKTHLACHLIMQWASIKRWNHGWVVAIMPRPVRIAPTPLITPHNPNPHAVHHATSVQTHMSLNDTLLAHHHHEPTRCRCGRTTRCT
jgi:hypothetical protein